MAAAIRVVICILWACFLVSGQSPYISLEGSPSVVQVGQAFKLTCTVTDKHGFFDKDIMWHPVGANVFLLNGLCDISPFDKGVYELDCGNRTEAGDYVFHLTILNVKDSDHGTTWMCEEMMWDRDKSNKVNLTVAIPVSPGSLTLKLYSGKQIVTVQEGTPVELTCDSGKIRPGQADVYWYTVRSSAPDIELPATNVTTTSTDNATTSVLNFYPTRNDTSIYCTAANAVNTKPVKSNLIAFDVTFPVAPGSLTLKSYSGKQTVTVQERSPVELTCTTGTIRPSQADVHWYTVRSSAPDIELPATNITTTSTDNATTSVLNFYPTRNDTSIYCTAANAVNTKPVKSNTIAFDVTYGPGNSVALMFASNTNSQVETNQIDDVTCSAVCNPSCSYSRIVSLVSAHAQPASVWTCQASNTYGTTEKNFTFRVDHIITSPDKTSTSENVTMKTGIAMLTIGILALVATVVVIAVCLVKERRKHNSSSSTGSSDIRMKNQGEPQFGNVHHQTVEYENVEANSKPVAPSTSDAPETGEQQYQEVAPYTPEPPNVYEGLQLYGNVRAKNHVVG